MTANHDREVALSLAKEVAKSYGIEEPVSQIFHNDPDKLKVLFTDQHGNRLGLIIDLRQLEGPKVVLTITDSRTKYLNVSTPSDDKRIVLTFTELCQADINKLSPKEALAITQARQAFNGFCRA